MENDIGIIILAGGKSSRMGTDKGLLLVNKLTIIQYLINTCVGISKNILIVSDNKNYQRFGFPIIEDQIKDIGPIGGLYSGLLFSKKEWNLVLSCDIPLVSVELLKELIAAKTDKYKVVVAKNQNRVHPLIGLYSNQVCKTIGNLIQKKSYKMSEIYLKGESMVLDLSHFPSKEFLNLNTIEELDTFKQILNDR